MLVHPDDLRRVDDLDVRRKVTGERTNRRLVTYEQDPILGVGAGVVEGARNDLGRSVIATHRVDRDRNAAAVSTAVTLRGMADLVDHGQVADSFVDCFGSIARRPWYQPQFGQTWWGSFGSWQWSHSTSFGTLSARWARRSPFRACETRRFGTPTVCGLL
jgi:hypothetical protein